MLYRMRLLVLFSLAFGWDMQVVRPPASSWKRTQCGGPSGSADLVTPWGKAVDPNKPLLPEYPRPMLVRGSGSRETGDASNWINLNGLWEWEAAPDGPSKPPFGRTLTGQILVPFPVESCLSGVAPSKSAGVVREMWYRLQVSGSCQDRCLLHFGAVDWQTMVWFNTRLMGNHTGGYDGFDFDITSFLSSTAPTEILVYVFDPSDGGAQPNGKQRVSAIDNPGGDTYTPSSGIWQTVWLETVPAAASVAQLKISTDMTSVTVLPSLQQSSSAGPIGIRVLDGSTVVAQANTTNQQAVTITVPSPKLWGPDSPFLYDLEVSVGSDVVRSYFGLRSFTLKDYPVPPTPATGPEVGKDRPGSDLPGSPFTLSSADPNLCWAQCNSTKACEAWAYAVPGCDGYAKPTCWLKATDGAVSDNKCRVSGGQEHPGGTTKRPMLNGKVTFLAGWLDQSFWPDGQYTAPSDDALKSDILAVKTFGLNMVRLHQKVNSERWYYHADVAGVVVFQDAVQKYGGASQATVPLFVADLTAMIHGRGSHPCIVQWTAFNEGDCWAAFTKEPYTVPEVVALARKVDFQQGRLLDTDSGGGANDPPLNTGDVNDIHTYPYPGHPRPSGDKYAMLGEFGGVGAFITGKEWVPTKCGTYLKVATPAEEASTYIAMTRTILSNWRDITASVYTQITDVELECDGFLNYDRSNKFSSGDTQAIAEANRALIRGP